MGGLVTYDSSDEDDDVQAPAQVKPPSSTDKQPQNGSSKQPQSAASTQPQPSGQSPASLAAAQPPQQPLGPVQGPALGPQLGPALDPSLPADTPSPSPLPDSQDPPRSPYSQTRSLLRDLTLPPVPQTAIPPSPPGSPPRALTSKFDTFLDLKRTKGIHFNARLASSTSVRNPGLMDKLLGFVGVDTSFENASDGATAAGTAQYETTLPRDVWDPAALPTWAYKTSLRRAVERAARERERKLGEKVEFVSAGTAMVSEVGDAVGVPGTGIVPSVTGKRKSRFDER